VRHLTGDVPELLGAATRILDETPRLRLTEGILTETAYVLTSFYEVPREQVVDSLVDLVSKQNIVMHGLDKDVTIQALLLCRPSKRVSFADALLWAAAMSSGSGACIYSFDRRFPSSGIELRQVP
jgi:predicted nucleic-acid-binding protein